jgi:nucleoside-diphosphate-sugar epimerase
MNILLTGSQGFFGKILYKNLKNDGHNVVGIDITNCDYDKSKIKCDITDYSELKSKLEMLNFDIVIHLATLIDFSERDQCIVLKKNIEMTENIIRLSNEIGINRLIFTSSNSIFLGNKELVIKEDTLPIPLDNYGRSKIESEKKIIEGYRGSYSIIRCTNIIDSGRFGIFTILFEILKNNATLWVLDGGRVIHQSIYAGDLIDAIKKLVNSDTNSIYNIGSDNIHSFYEMFHKVIIRTKSNSKIRSLSSFLVIPILKLFHKLKISPIGPYQFRMLTQDFQFDTTKIKKELGWTPTLNNYEMLIKAYDSYITCDDTNNNSANSKKINLGILNILKYIKL